jgi:hypothetical protein
MLPSELALEFTSLTSRHIKLILIIVHMHLIEQALLLIYLFVASNSPKEILLKPGLKTVRYVGDLAHLPELR